MSCSGWRGSVAEASAATLREMNPLVHVAARRARGAGANPNPDAALLKGVDVAVLTGASASPALAWDAACRAAGVAFYAAACRGSASHFFADLGEHMYTPTVRTCCVWWREASGAFWDTSPGHVEHIQVPHAETCPMPFAPHGVMCMGLVCPLRCTI